MCKHNYRVLVLFDLCLLLAFFSCTVIAQDTDPEDTLSILTWNVRGYPEKEQAARNWFSEQLLLINPHIVCIQEIANTDSISTFHENEKQFTQSAFLDSGDGQDNAIFAVDAVKVKNLPDPEGFQHPAQAAFVSYRGFDAVIVTVHLSWTNIEFRENEKALLKNVVSKMLKTDPDIIITGDFNSKEDNILRLADDIGMKVMVPIDQVGVGTTHAGNRYDHFLISTDLANEEAMGCRILTYDDEDLEIAKKVSDHLPVLACFKTDYKYTDCFSKDKNKILNSEYDPETNSSSEKDSAKDNPNPSLKAKIQVCLLNRTLPGGFGALAWFIFGIRFKRIRNNQYIIKGILEIIGGMLVATFLSDLISKVFVGDPITCVAFLTGMCWAVIIQALRKRITDNVENP